MSPLSQLQYLRTVNDIEHSLFLYTANYKHEKYLIGLYIYIPVFRQKWRPIKKN